MPPLGLLYIAGYLKLKGISCTLIDFSIKNLDKKSFVELLVRDAPKVIGISTYNETWYSQKIISNLIRRILPNVPIVAGGAFATFCYDDMFKDNIVDYVIRGEGEIAFYQLYSYLFNDKEDINLISGLVYRHNDRLNINKMYRIEDLDMLPFPDRDLINLDDYVLGYTISTARGCPGECIFCSSKAFWGKQIYFRSADSVVEEVLYIHSKYNQNIIYFADDTFTLHKQRALEFCKKIKEHNIDFMFGFESRADILDEDFVRELYSAGFKKIQIGLESADNDILRKLKKKVTIEQIENGISLAAKYNMHISVSYIIGHAFDTKETIYKTLDFIEYIKEKYNAYTMVSVNTPFPGTEQYNRAKELGITIYSDDWDNYRLNHPIISTNNLSRTELKQYFEYAQRINNK